MYSALIGRYEQLNEQPIANDTDVEFICFTDDPELTSDSWDIRLIEPRFPMDSIRSARYFKTRGPELLAGYDESLWIDNSVLLRDTPDSILDNWLAEADIAIPRHSYRKTVIGEFDAVATDGYDDPARVYEQLIHYSSLRAETMQEHPYWTALVARRHIPVVDEVMKLWHDHIMRYSRRDQLSINFVLGSSGLPVNALDIDNMESVWHEWPVRADRKWHLTQDRLANALRVPQVELGRLENSLTIMNSKLSELEQLKERAVLEERAMVEERDNLHRLYRNTTSWKVTAPLRALSSLLRRG